LIKAIGGAMIWGRLFACYPPLRNATEFTRLAVGYIQKEIRRRYRRHRFRSRIDRFIDCCIRYCCGLVEWESSHFYTIFELSSSSSRVKDYQCRLLKCNAMIDVTLCCDTLSWDSGGNIISHKATRSMAKTRSSSFYRVSLDWNQMFLIAQYCIISTPTTDFVESESSRI
jgi:hypothetical protein